MVVRRRPGRLAKVMQMWGGGRGGGTGEGAQQRNGWAAEEPSARSRFRVEEDVAPDCS